MTTDALVAPLRRVAAFRGLTPDQLNCIARAAERMMFRAGDTIIEDGEDGDAGYVIVAGAVERKGDPETQPEWLGSGTLIGETAMLTEAVHHATVVACGNVRAFKLPRATMHALMEDDPGLAEHFVGIITRRLIGIADALKKLDTTLANVSSQDARAGLT